jgi:tetratricopeptide (TPR) repeat protein
MTFEEILDQAMAMLQRRGRVTYRTLKRQFQLDDDALEDLKAEIIKAQRLAVDEEGEVLVWTGGTGPATAPTMDRELAPPLYTPSHLAEKILHSKAAMEGERKQDEAGIQAQRALEFSRAHKERGYEAYAQRLLGEVAAHREPPQGAQAEAFYRQALDLAAELGMRPLQAHCHLGLGTLYARIGRPDQARTALCTAIDLYRAMEMTFWLPQAEATLARVT